MTDNAGWLIENQHLVGGCIWLVVGPPLWKIWLRQLGWWLFPRYGKIKNGNQTTNQNMDDLGLPDVTPISGHQLCRSHVSFTTMNDERSVFLCASPESRWRWTSRRTSFPVEASAAKTRGVWSVKPSLWRNHPFHSFSFHFYLESHQPATVHAHYSKTRAVLPGIRIEANTKVVMSHSLEMLTNHGRCAQHAWKITGHEMPLL